MKASVKVVLRWLIDTKSSEKSPRGEHFVLPAKFDHQQDEWTKEAWSVAIDTIENIFNGCQHANARFLMPNAPNEWLVKGKCFVLFEGQLAIAEVEVE